LNSVRFVKEEIFPLSALETDDLGISADGIPREAYHLSSRLMPQVSLPKSSSEPKFSISVN
jgi:hypothetical protein